MKKCAFKSNWTECDTHNILSVCEWRFKQTLTSVHITDKHTKLYNKERYSPLQGLTGLNKHSVSLQSLIFNRVWPLKLSESKESVSDIPDCRKTKKWIRKITKSTMIFFENLDHNYVLVSEISCYYKETILTKCNWFSGSLFTLYETFI